MSARTLSIVAAVLSLLAIVFVVFRKKLGD